MAQFYYVYILESEFDSSHYYVGVTENLQQRLAEHNSGKVLHTSKFVPWQIKNAIAFRERGKPAAFERYLKSGSGRAFAKRYF